jgi:hypothetical protein
MASSYRTAPVVAASIVGGYAVGRATKVRALGGVALAAGGVLAGREWLRHTNGATTAALAATYLAAFGLSHPLAKKIGAWPSVLTVAGVAAGAAWAVSDRRTS